MKKHQADERCFPLTIILRGLRRSSIGADTNGYIIKNLAHGPESQGNGTAR